MAFATVRGIEIYYEIHGDGPCVLNISGSGNDLRNSQPDKDPLNKNFTVLHYDQRWLGQTTGGATSTTMADYADDGAALARAIGWDRCHVVGTSFGGMVALNLVVRHQELVDRLVLRCTSPGGSLPSYPLHELSTLEPMDQLEARLRLFDSRYDAEADEPIPGLGGYVRMARAQTEAQIKRGDSSETLAGAQRQLEARRHHDVEGSLGSITSPTLVCAGRFDEIAPLDNSYALHAGIGGSTLEIFEGGHAFMLQDRSAAQAVKVFLQNDAA